MRVTVRIALVLLPASLAAQQQQAGTSLLNTRVRATATHPIPRRVVGTLVELTADSVIVLAQPLPRMNATREAFARSQVQKLEVSRLNLRVAIPLAVLLGGIGFFLSTFDETDGQTELAVQLTSMGMVGGFGLGFLISHKRWVAVPIPH